MENLTQVIEAILFASGNSVSIADIAEKLEVMPSTVQRCIDELKERYSDASGIRLLEFNKKVQLATNPAYQEQVSAVLNTIREKELTRVALECLAIVAYKQPITRTEIELMRGCNSDYGVNVLLQKELICPCGKKNTIGHPVLFATTDEFLKRFKLNTLEDLPDYEDFLTEGFGQNTNDSYLYARREYGNVTDAPEEVAAAEDEAEKGEEEKPARKQEAEEVDEEGYNLPDFLRNLDKDDIVKIS